MSNIKKRSDDKIGVDYIRNSIAEKKIDPISGETISDASVTIYGSKYKKHWSFSNYYPYNIRQETLLE